MTTAKTMILGACTCLGIAASAITAIYARPEVDLQGISSVHAIVDNDGELIGATRNGKWIPQEKAAGLLKGGEMYRVYGPASSIGTVSGGKPVSADQPCPNQMTIPVTMPAGSVVGINGTWNAMPRTVKSENLNQAVYRAAVKKLLIANGIRNPDVRIDQIFRCDLDNDGTDEVLISAHRYTATGGSHDPMSGDYTLIMLRKIVRGQVKTSLITGEFYPKHRTEAAPNTCRINGFYDFMGDKQMQIVVGWQYYEGAGTDVYDMRKDGRTNVVLSAACGA